MGHPLKHPSLRELGRTICVQVTVLPVVMVAESRLFSRTDLQGFLSAIRASTLNLNP